MAVHNVLVRKGEGEKELKFRDTEFEKFLLSTHWRNEEVAQGCINSVPQGDGDSERTGRVTYVHSVHIHGRIFSLGGMDFASQAKDQVCRVIIYLDRQTNEDQVDCEFVMTEQDDDILSFRRLGFMQRFEVLAQFRIRLRHGRNTFLQSNGLWAHVPNIQHFDGEYQFKEPLVVNYATAGGDVDDIADSSIHVCAVGSDEDLGPPALQYVTRVRYTNG